MKNKLIIWNYLIDLMENNPQMQEGPIKILESNDNYFKVWFVIGTNKVIISFDIRIEYSFLKDAQIIIENRIVKNKEHGDRYLARDSDLIKLILPLIRNNKLKRIGV